MSLRRASRNALLTSTWDSSADLWSRDLFHYHSTAAACQQQNCFSYTPLFKIATTKHFVGGLITTSVWLFSPTPVIMHITTMWCNNVISCPTISKEDLCIISTSWSWLSADVFSKGTQYYTIQLPFKTSLSEKEQTISQYTFLNGQF